MKDIAAMLNRKEEKAGNSRINIRIIRSNPNTFSPPVSCLQLHICTMSYALGAFYARRLPLLYLKTVERGVAEISNPEAFPRLDNGDSPVKAGVIIPMIRTVFKAEVEEFLVAVNCHISRPGSIIYFCHRGKACVCPVFVISGVKIY